MYTSVLLEFFFANFFARGLNRFTEPHFEAVNFAQAVKGRKLNGNVIKELEVTSEASCQFECVKATSCLSYNFLPLQRKCQLSKSDRFVGHMNFTQGDGALYRGIQVIKKNEKRGLTL